MAQDTPPPVLRVTFEGDKIGRRSGVSPFEVAEYDLDGIWRAIHRRASKYLLSSGIDVELDIDPENNTGQGIVVVGGFRTVATFTIAPAKED